MDTPHRAGDADDQERRRARRPADPHVAPGPAKGGPEAKYSLARRAALGELVNRATPSRTRRRGRNTTDLHIMKDPDEQARRHARRVRFVDDCVGPQVEKAVRELRDGDVLLLENLRFRKDEESNNANFASQLAKLGDVTSTTPSAPPTASTPARSARPRRCRASRG
jgi:hypothetical protein